MMQNNRNKITRKAEIGFTGFLSAHKKGLLSIAAFVLTMTLWFIIWALCAKGVGISFILPSPIEAFEAFFKLIVKKEFIIATLGTLARMLSGYVLGIIIGTIGAFSAFAIPPIRMFMAPLIKTARATPVASFILICALWMTSYATPVFIAFLMVFPIVYENVVSGLAQTDKKLIEAANIYRFSLFKKITELYAPSAMPYFGSACMTSLGLAWKSCISAEALIVTAKSVGYYIYTSKLYFETEQLFAWTIAIILLSVALEYIVKLISRGVKKLFERRFVSDEKH